MTCRPLTRCGLCDSTNLNPVLHLGSSPPPCVMHPVGQPPIQETSYPLEVVVCQDCTLAQLSVIVDPEVVFQPDFPYSSGNSRQLHDNFHDLFRSARQFLVRHRLGDLKPDDLVVDIGANDGTLLSKFEGCRTVGIEPTRQAEKIEGQAYQEFFDAELAQRMVGWHGQAKVVTACNVLAHVDDLHSVMEGIRSLLAPDGVLIAENHDLASLAGGQWDMVYHEHLRYFSVRSFARLLEEYGLHCALWRKTDVHGGSFRMFATHDRLSDGWDRGLETYTAHLGVLQAKADRDRDIIRTNVSRQPMAAIGATARGTTILNFCGLDRQDIEYVCEVPGSDKLNHYIPGTLIPVVEEEALFDGQRPGLLLSWHLKDIIVPKLRARNYHEPILVPLPEPHYILPIATHAQAHI